MVREPVKERVILGLRTVMFSLIDKSGTIASSTGSPLNPFLYKLSVQILLQYSAVGLDPKLTERTLGISLK